MRICLTKRYNVRLRRVCLGAKCIQSRRNTHQLAQPVRETTTRTWSHPITPQFPQPPPNKRADPKAWLSVLTSIPEEAYENEVLETVPYRLALETIPWQYDSHTIIRAAAQARAQANIDLLHSLAITFSRWDALLSLVSTLARTNMPRADVLNPQTALMSHLCFPPRQSLAETLHLELNGSIEESIERTENIMSASASMFRALNYEQTVTRQLSHTREQNTADKQDRIGEILLSLGNLVITAASIRSSDPQQADIHLFNVISALSYLSDVAWSSDTMFKKRSTGDKSGIEHSAWLSPHKESIKEVFARLPHAQSVQQHHPSITETSNNFDKGVNLLIQRVGDRVWLEFILQICLQGGWFRQGSLILQSLRQGHGRARLKLKLLSPAYSKQKAKESLSKAGTKEFGVNVESVCALIDGFVMDLSSTPQQLTFASVSQSIYSVKFLKSILDEDATGLRFTSWHSIVTRLANCPWMDIGSRPQLMELILQLVPLNAREVNSANATPLAYVNDGTAATLSLFHKTLLAYTESGDLKGALRVLHLLRNLTRDNEFETLNTFKMKLRATTVSALGQPGTRLTPYEGDIESTVPSCEIPMLRPQIPTVSFAALLDLISVRGDTQLGKQLIHSIASEKAVTPSQLYSNQDLAPALIRFATVSNNPDLLSEVISSQPAEMISGSTVVSICKQRIQQQHWDEVESILQTLKQHPSLKWSFDDATAIASALLPFLTSTSKLQSPEDHQIAIRILRSLLRGGGRSNDLQSLVQLFANIEPNVAVACRDLLKSKNAPDIDISVNAFNMLMSEVAVNYGSRKCRDIWETWCGGTSIQRPQALDLSDDSAPNTQTSATLPLPEDVDEEIPLIAKTKYVRTELSARGVEASLSTLRIIIHQALTELETIKDTADQYTLDQLDNPRDDVEDLIEWTATVLRDDFLLSDEEIDYELDGWLSRQQHVTLSTDVPYSADTIFHWLKLIRDDRYWAHRLEEFVRSFALSENSLQVATNLVFSRLHKFLKCLVSDYGLHITITKKNQHQVVKLMKPGSGAPKMPSMTVDDYLKRQKPYHRKR